MAQKEEEGIIIEMNANAQKHGVRTLLDDFLHVFDLQM
jgi:hypothetical protein